MHISNVRIDGCKSICEHTIVHVLSSLNVEIGNDWNLENILNVVLNVSFPIETYFCRAQYQIKWTLLIEFKLLFTSNFLSPKQNEL